MFRKQLKRFLTQRSRLSLVQRDAMLSLHEPSQVARSQPNPALAHQISARQQSQNAGIQPRQPARKFPIHRPSYKRAFLIRLRQVGLR